MLHREVVEVVKTQLDKAMSDLIWCWEVEPHDHQKSFRSNISIILCSYLRY